MHATRAIRPNISNLDPSGEIIGGNIAGKSARNLAFAIFIAKFGPHSVRIGQFGSNSSARFVAFAINLAKGVRI